MFDMISLNGPPYRLHRWGATRPSGAVAAWFPEFGGAWAHLAHRLQGGGDFVAPWPRRDRALNVDERKELQTLLARSGHYEGEIDGLIGSGTMGAIMAWQRANGMTADGYVSAALLERLRRS